MCVCTCGAYSECLSLHYLTVIDTLLFTESDSLLKDICTNWKNHEEEPQKMIEGMEAFNTQSEIRRTRRSSWSCCHRDSAMVSASGAVNPQRGICRVVKGALQRRKWAERSCLHIKEKSSLEWKPLGSRITSPGRPWSLWPHYRGHKAQPDGPVSQYATGRASPWASWRNRREVRSVNPSLGVYGLSFVLGWILKQHPPAPRIWCQG